MLDSGELIFVLAPVNNSIDNEFIKWQNQRICFKNHLKKTNAVDFERNIIQITKDLIYESFEKKLKHLMEDINNKFLAVQNILFVEIDKLPNAVLYILDYKDKGTSIKQLEICVALCSTSDVSLVLEDKELNGYKLNGLMHEAQMILDLIARFDQIYSSF